MTLRNSQKGLKGILKVNKQHVVLQTALQPSGVVSTKSPECRTETPTTNERPDLVSF